MKKIIQNFPKVTLALGLVLSFCLISPAQAGDYGSSGQPYFSLSAQVVSPDAIDVESAIGFPNGGILTARDASLDFEVGWGVTGAFGWLYDSNWHYEVELGHRAFDLADGFATGNAQPVTGEWNTQTFFINGGYDFRSDSFITPYLEVGLGAALHEVTIEGFSNLPVIPAISEQFQVTPAVQAKMGVNLEVADDMDIVLGYRFVTAVNPDFDAIAFDRLDIHNFELGLKFYIEDWIN
ncbi:MAG: porin family protein [Candidatus Nitronauta litoralis]|uniref:Porin family protein n=1 Tax=Candidatus Nitronauta litoralis TaxID=2705533 RepID=A0A7T0BVE2_9BACT|nr:MAG: porin family protein [Candidatus Nitronauta litoralis]